MASAFSFLGGPPSTRGMLPPPLAPPPPLFTCWWLVSTHLCPGRGSERKALERGSRGAGGCYHYCWYCWMVRVRQTNYLHYLRYQNCRVFLWPLFLLPAGVAREVPIRKLHAAHSWREVFALLWSRHLLSSSFLECVDGKHLAADVAAACVLLLLPPPCAVAAACCRLLLRLATSCCCCRAWWGV